MGTIITAAQLPGIAKNLKVNNKLSVLVGGCFDVLHPGHVIFLKKAKKAGDILIVLLESDEKVKRLKGITRPVHTQTERAQVLAAIKYVDYVIMLPTFATEEDYDELVMEIRPDVIAATKGDMNARHHKRSAGLVGAKFEYVTKMIGNHSTSRILDPKNEILK